MGPGCWASTTTDPVKAKVSARRVIDYGFLVRPLRFRVSSTLICPVAQRVRGRAAIILPFMNSFCQVLVWHGHLPGCKLERMLVARLILARQPAPSPPARVSVQR